MMQSRVEKQAFQEIHLASITRTKTALQSRVEKQAFQAKTKDSELCLIRIVAIPRRKAGISSQHTAAIKIIIQVTYEILCEECCNPA